MVSRVLLGSGYHKNLSWTLEGVVKRSSFALDLEGLGFGCLLACLQSPPYQEEPTIKFLTFWCSYGKEISRCRHLSYNQLVHYPLCFSVSYNSSRTDW